jgi:nitrite reductase/ring-hydroxylating ferredoxin subunit/uncharacterized membrane protein
MSLLRTTGAAAPHLGENVEALIKAIPGFGRAAQGASVALHNLVLGGGAATRTLADLLHGTWLGHPLHALLVEIPIGAWSASALFDLLAVATGSHNAAWAADALVTLGVASAVPAAMAGMADYSGIREDVAAQAAAHAILNSAALGLFLGSLAARRADRRGLGVSLSYTALAVAGGSAWLGGDMVYRRRVGANFNDPPAHSEGWIAVLSEGELAAGQARRVVIGDDAVMVYRDAGGIYAIGAVCSHAGGPLEGGTVMGHCVECPWHHSVFNMRDGSVVHGPATMPQARYDARSVNGLIEVRLVRAGKELAALPEGERERSVGEG